MLPVQLLGKVMATINNTNEPAVPTQSGTRNPNKKRRNPNEKRRNPNVKRRNPNERRRNPNEKRRNPNEKRRNPNVKRRKRTEWSRKSIRGKLQIKMRKEIRYNQ